METLITRTYYGGQDLFYGVPNLENAVVSKVETREDQDDYITELTMNLSNGNTYVLIIKQNK